MVGNNKFNKLKNNTMHGALNIVEDSIKEKKSTPAIQDDDNTTVLRSYMLTKKQVKMLQQKKAKELNLSLSEIVGKAIEAYCNND